MAERNALFPFFEGVGAANKLAWNHLVKGAMDNDVVERTTVFPLGKYSDGHVRPAWPGLLSAPVEGFNSMWERGDEANVTNPDALEASSIDSFDAAGGAMTGGLAAGALGAVPEGALTANGGGLAQKVKGWFARTSPQDEPHLDETYIDITNRLPDGVQVRGVTGAPYSANVFRGSSKPNDSAHFDEHGLYASSSPAEASGFAWPGRTDLASVSPLNVDFRNPLVVDASGADWSAVSYQGKSLGVPELADVARGHGHDGLVVNDVFEQVRPNTTTVALQPGTVRSALTGGLLYSNSPQGASVPLAVQAAERGQGIRQIGQDFPGLAQHFNRLGDLADEKQTNPGAARLSEIMREERAIKEDMERLDFADRMTAAADTPLELSQPQSVYHGTQYGFDRYDSDIARAHSDAARDAGGDVAFVSPNRAFAERFAGSEGETKNLTLSPGYYFDPQQDAHLARIAPFIDSLPDAQQRWNGLKDGSWGAVEDRPMLDELRRQGFDGAHMREEFYDANNLPRTANTIAVLSRGKLNYSDTGDPFFANAPTGFSVPLSLSEDKNRNALMPPRHHSSSQSRDPGGRFTK